MRNHSAIAAALALAAACSSATPAPPEWTITPERAGSWVHGHWVVAALVNGDGVAGELIALGVAGEREPTSLYVGQGEAITAVPVALIRLVTVVEHDPSTEGGAAWTTAGAFSTISHGLALTLSLPGWLILGDLPSAAQGREGIRTYTDVVAGRYGIRKFARFPQGLPPALRATVDGAKP
jgi:hypothetical protein